jgi:VWFA-related protein
LRATVQNAPPKGAKRDATMTRIILAISIVLLLCDSAHAQQPIQPGTPQQGGQPGAPAAPIQPGQTAPQPKPPQKSAPSPPTATAQQADTRHNIRIRTELVIVPVTVKNRDGQLVGDLQRDEFRIFSDGSEQQIVLFDSQPFPLSAVVLLDNDLAEKEAEQVKKSLDAIAGAFGPNDEVALVTYAEFPETVSDFSFNNDSIFTALKRLDLSSHSSTIINDPTTADGPIINGQTQPNGTGTTGQGGVQVRGFGKAAIHNSLDDAIYAAGQMLKGRGRDRRKIIFLITDGSNTHNNQHSFNETLHSLLLADVSVFAISVTHQSPVGRSIIQHGVAEIDKYAAATGGDTFYAARENGLSRLYSAVTEQARNVYTITFAPREADRTKDYHTIEVRVRRPDLDVTARQGYFQAGLQ